MKVENSILINAGNILISGVINAKNFYAKSTGTIYNNHIINCSSVVNFEADLGFNFKARQIIEGYEKKTVKKWYGKKKTHIEPKIKTFESSVASNANTN